MENKKIKITHILPELGYGGAERLLVDLLKNIDRDKFNVEVICLIKGGDFVEDLAEIDVPVKILGKRGKLGLAMMWRLKKYLVETQPDIVHTHLFAGDFWGRVAAYLAGVKIIISTEHNINTSEGKLKDWLKSKTNRLATKIIAVSRSVKNYTIKKYQTPAEKISVIYNGIDISRFSFESVDFNNKIIFGTVGRLTKQKGHKYLISAFKKVSQKLPEAELWIVGEGELRDDLTKQIAKLNLTEKVKLLGTRKNIPAMLNEFDIFVMPSVWEGLGIVVLEAMASGLPIIASDVDGLSELVKDNQNGLLFESKNIEQLSQKMTELVQNETLADKFSRAGREMVENNFDLKKVVREYEEVYVDVL